MDSNAGPRLMLSIKEGIFALLSCMIAYPTAPVSISRDREPVSVGAITNGKLLVERMYCSSNSTVKECQSWDES